jgi:hypothetical protein
MEGTLPEISLLNKPPGSILTTKFSILPNSQNVLFEAGSCPPGGKMNSKLIMRLSMLGILSMALSFFMVFSANVQAATCTATLTCASGLMIDCSGDNGCRAGDAGGGYVSCKNTGGLTITKYCPAVPPHNGY